MTMDAVIYGEIPRANKVALASAPPERVLRYVRMVPLNTVLKFSAFTYGTGRTAPIR